MKTKKKMIAYVKFTHSCKINMLLISCYPQRWIIPIISSLLETIVRKIFKNFFSKLPLIELQFRILTPKLRLLQTNWYPF